MKTSFFRNMPNYKTLCEHTSRYKGIVAEYCTVASVYLENHDFIAFCDNFKSNYVYLLPYIDTAVIEHGVWKCVLITGCERELLVVMDHYQYPRYIAISKIKIQ